MLRSLLIAAVLVSTLGVSACNSGNKEQQPTADEQKQIQEEQQKAIGATKATDIRNGAYHERAASRFRAINGSRQSKEDRKHSTLKANSRQQQQQPENDPPQQ